MIINKKGISPLIATVLIIGFTIVIAALVITWGTNLFKKTQERTGEVSDLNLACTEVLGGMSLTQTNVDESTITLTIDNGAGRDVNGFVVRVYNTGETSADTIDTEEEPSSVVSPDGSYIIGGNSLKTFTITFDNTVVPEPVKVGVRPKVVVAGSTKQCPGEATKEL